MKYLFKCKNKHQIYPTPSVK